MKVFSILALGVTCALAATTKRDVFDVEMKVTAYGGANCNALDNNIGGSKVYEIEQDSCHNMDKIQAQSFTRIVTQHKHKSGKRNCRVEIFGDRDCTEGYVVKQHGDQDGCTTLDGHAGSMSLKCDPEEDDDDEDDD